MTCTGAVVWRPVGLSDDSAFTFNYKQAGNLSGATPYARVFVDPDKAVDSDGDGTQQGHINMMSSLTRRWTAQ